MGKGSAQGSRRQLPNTYNSNPVASAENFKGQAGTAAAAANAGGGINKNLTNALRVQNSEYTEVREFLAPIKLDKYFDKLVDNGIEDLETILEL